MEVIYLSSSFENEDVQNIFTDLRKVPYATNKYNTLLCMGIAENGINITALSLIPVTRLNCTKIFIKSKIIKKDKLIKIYLFTINIPIIKNILRCINIFFRVLFAKKDTVLVYDLFAISGCLGMTFAAKLRKFKRICIVTDIPKYIIKNGISLKLHNWVMNNATGYVILTEQMVDEVDITKNKLKVVIEGIVDSTTSTQIGNYKKDENKKIVMYAGSIHKLYGIDVLISSFIKIRKENEELHIYGSGDYEKDILELVKKYSFIKYFGSCPNVEVIKAEKEVNLLVNPRSSKGEYTKYSFPSKVMEYMVSGTPVLMAKLQGISKEYYQYCYTFDDKIADGLTNKLRLVLDKNNEELNNMGNSARNFVLINKNSKVQAKKLIDCFIS